MPELTEERQAKIEATLGQMDKRLTNVEMAIRDLNIRLDSLNDKIEDVRNSLTTKIDTNFRWTIAIMITMWVTLILAIIFKG